MHQFFVPAVVVKLVKFETGQTSNILPLSTSSLSWQEIIECKQASVSRCDFALKFNLVTPTFFFLGKVAQLRVLLKLQILSLDNSHFGILHFKH